MVWRARRSGGCCQHWGGLVFLEGCVVFVVAREVIFVFGLGEVKALLFRGGFVLGSGVECVR